MLLANTETLSLVKDCEVDSTERISDQLSGFTIFWKALVRTILLFPMIMVSFVLTVPLIMALVTIQEIRYQWRYYRGEVGPQVLCFSQHCRECGELFTQEVRDGPLPLVDRCDMCYTG